MDIIIPSLRVGGGEGLFHNECRRPHDDYL